MALPEPEKIEVIIFTVYLPIFIGVLIVLLALYLIRNRIVYNANKKALTEIYSRDNYDELLQQYNPIGNFDKNLYDLSKWKYSQFFKDL